MLRKISTRLVLTACEAFLLKKLKQKYPPVCKLMPTEVVESRYYWLQFPVLNRLYRIMQMGSHMLCNAISSICKAYQARNELKKNRKDQSIPKIAFYRRAFPSIRKLFANRLSQELLNRANKRQMISKRDDLILLFYLINNKSPDCS